MKVNALRDRILAVYGDFGEQQTDAGIIIQNTYGKPEGIGARWFMTYSVGEEHKDLTEPGEWILVAHGRWTEGVSGIKDEDIKLDSGEYSQVWQIDPEGVLASADEKPEGQIYVNPDVVSAPKKTR